MLSTSSSCKSIGLLHYFLVLNKERVILVGCDDDQSLASIFTNLRGNPCFTHSIISMTRVADLLYKAKSQHPHLITLAFNKFDLINQDLITTHKAVNNRTTPKVSFRACQILIQKDLIAWSRIN